MNVLKKSLFVNRAENAKRLLPKSGHAPRIKGLTQQKTAPENWVRFLISRMACYAVFAVLEDGSGTPFTSVLMRCAIHVRIFLSRTSRWEY